MWTQLFLKTEQNNVLFPDTAYAHTHLANSAANPDIFQSALQTGKKKSATSPIRCGQRQESGCFRIWWPTKIVSSLLPNKRPTWRQSVLAQFLLSQSGYHRMRVDRRIRFEYATCWQWNFWIRKEKVAGSKITGYAWTGRKTKFMTATATALTGTSLKSNTVAVHVRYKSLYISLPSSAKQQRKMTKFCVVWRTWTTTANFFEILFQIYRGVPDSVSW